MTVRTENITGSQPGATVECFSCGVDASAKILFAVASLGHRDREQAWAKAYRHDSVFPSHDILVEFVHKVKAE